MFVKNQANASIFARFRALMVSKETRWLYDFTLFTSGALESRCKQNLMLRKRLGGMMIENIHKNLGTRELMREK